MYHKILVPMEDEHDQGPALEHSRALAKSTGAEVLLIWLVPVLASEERFFSQIQVEPGSSGARRKERGEAHLSQEVERFRAAGISTSARVVITPQAPEDAIVDLARQEEADLILMTTLPRSAVGRFLFGSVGEKVRRRSPVPVLFVQPAESQSAEGEE